MKMLCRRRSALYYVVILVCGIFGTIYFRNIFTATLLSKKALHPEFGQDRDFIGDHTKNQDFDNEGRSAVGNVNHYTRDEDRRNRLLEEEDRSDDDGPQENNRQIKRAKKNHEELGNPNNPESHYADMPMVYMYQDGSLKHVPNFCKWTPEYLCAAMTTETGPMPVYVHHIQKTDTSSVSGALFNKGVWEKKIVDVFLRQLKKFPEAGVLDLGCNVGSFAFLAARMGRKVVAVDAVMDNMLKVCKTVVKNELTKQVVMVVNAVYEDHRTVVFDTSNTNTYELSKIRLGYQRQRRSICEEDSKVQTIMMDDLLAVITFKTAVMKIDVESFEYFALNGAKKLFKEIDIQAILMEWYHVARTSKGQLLVDLLKDYGYIPYSIPENGLPREFQSENYRSWTHDVLFLKS